MFTSTGRARLNDADFAPKICSDPDSVFSLLDPWLTKRITADTVLEAKRMGDVVWNFLRITSSQENHFSRTNPYQHSYARSHKKAIPIVEDIPLTVESLLPGGTSSTFGQIGLMLREALNIRRERSDASGGKRIGNSYVRRLMQGLRPIVGDVPLENGKDVDHFDIVRFDNRYSILLKKAFKPRELTTREGVSSMFAYMSTGQGNLTSEFIESTSMVFPDLNACVAAFSLAIHKGVVCSNMKIWGRTCRHMSAEPTKPSDTPGAPRVKLTVREKFAEYFNKTVQDSWIELLGELAGEDPSSYNGPRPKYEDIRRWLDVHKLTCFGSGLTPVQFCNNLVDLGLCEAPTMEDMADWVASNRHLGACSGLKKLGFALENRGKLFIKAAFMVVYQHLDTNLHGDDKIALKFSSIFVEHLLCKAARFSNLFRKGDGITFSDIGQVEMRKHAGTWVKGESVCDESGKLFPIPLTIDYNIVQSVVEHV
ncbi:hypothetical protein BJ138DRAFT_1120402 [Hygrophoropsis aurantiaca]|uniref:Uncharacterized protein n=1 Tax=Hygrophoropsis aurantiaca TaxID=72124 RepID=A0ACB7ZQL1_9AGAM|nr:hypothetical protein BJ138DRAFT_1120402 [Hygrophoropsis aurantiaca]